MTTILTLQPGAEGVDTRILRRTTDGLGSNYNCGTSTQLGMGQNTVNIIYRSLLKFDLSALPAGSAVLGAILTMTLSGYDDNDTVDMPVHRALTQWWEGVKNTVPPDAGQDGSTWDLRNANGAVPWAGGAGGASGLDWAAVATATTPVKYTGPFTWDVTADVRAWHDGTYPNYGWWILGNEAPSKMKSFHSSDAGAGVEKPKLTIAYIPPNTTVGTGTQRVGVQGGAIHVRVSP